MMKTSFSSALKSYIFVCILLGSPYLNAQSPLPPTVTIQGVNVDETKKELTVNYDITDPEAQSTYTVSLQVSLDGGNSFSNITSNVTGDIGASAVPGTGFQITWNYDGVIRTADTYQIRVIADEAAVDIQELVDQVSEQRLQNDLAAIEGIRHRTAGVNLLEATKDTLRSRFNRLGLLTREQSWMYGNYEAQNIIGHHHGITEPDKTYIVDAHFDTVNDAPGADDNGSGTVGFLEIARILSKYPTRKTVDCVGFDLEEAGIVGSEEYVSNGQVPGVTIEGVLNFEMIGFYSEEANSQRFPAGFQVLYPDIYNAIAADNFRGNFITNVGDNQSMSLMNTYTDAAATYVPDLKVVSLSANAPGFYVPDLLRSDHARFWQAQIPALMLTDGAEFRNPYYHSPDDTSDKLDFTFMKQTVQAALATIATLAEPRVGDAAVASFDITGTVNTTELDACQLMMYPLPANDKLAIELKDCSTTWQTLQLVDIQGRTVFSKSNPTFLHQIEINTTSLSSGLYFLILKNKEGAFAKKINIAR